MAFEVKKAKRQRRPLKISFEGLSGGGKTFSALRLAFLMRRLGIGKRIVLLDSENESGGLYDGVVMDGEKWEYETATVPPEKQNPAGYTEAYEYVTGEGYDIVIIDSMTHAWKGALARVDQIAARNRNDKFGSGWRVVTPEQEKMLRTITDPRAHLLTTTRVKGEYEITSDDGGKKHIKKMGMKADQRDGHEYEYDCVLRMDPEDHSAKVEKVRGCMAMDGAFAVCPGPDFWKPLLDWWMSADAVMTPEDVARQRYKNAASLPELAAVWGSLPEAVKAATLADKDRRKAELTAPAAEEPVPSDDPAY